MIMQVFLKWQTTNMNKLKERNFITSPNKSLLGYSRRIIKNLCSDILDFLIIVFMLHHRNYGRG